MKINSNNNNKTNRIEEKMRTLQQSGKKAFITYMTAGLPDLAGTKNLILAQERAGCDVVELGIPFSDPAADGPVIQEASYRAICNGTTLKKVFCMMEELRGEGAKVPVIFMMYYNTILHYGVKEFAEKCRQTGVDGLIIPDLPLEEQEELQECLQMSDKTILIQLVSPVSKERIPQILKRARGFVYCVSSMGVTGQGGSFYSEIRTYLETVKKQSRIPVMMGFGIRTAEDVKPVIDVIDGVIVGSYFISLLEEKQYSIREAETYCRGFKTKLQEVM